MRPAALSKRYKIPLSNHWQAVWCPCGVYTGLLSCLLPLLLHQLCPCLLQSATFAATVTHFRGFLKTHAAAQNTPAASGGTGRVRRSAQNTNRIAQGNRLEHKAPSGVQHSSSRSNSTPYTPGAHGANDTSGPRVRRSTSAVPQAAPTTRHAGSSSNATAVDARKNPELYSLTQDQSTAPLQQQQQQQLDRTGLAAPATPPWPLPPVQGSVGSTGAYSSEPEHTAQQQHTSQQQQAVNSSSSRAAVLHRKPEVLAPAGGWPQLRAAVENGADAVYFGVTGFNARAR